MSLVVVELLDALKAAGVDDEKARPAARAVAAEAVQHESRFGTIEGRLTLLTYMVGVLAAVMLNRPMRIAFLDINNPRQAAALLGAFGSVQCTEVL